MAISPALLLSMGLALVSSALFFLCVRLPLYYLPVAWVLSVTCFVVAQILDAVMGGHLLVIGTLDVGGGLALNIGVFGSVGLGKVWYDRNHHER